MTLCASPPGPETGVTRQSGKENQDIRVVTERDSAQLPSSFGPPKMCLTCSASPVIRRPSVFLRPGWALVLQEHPCLQMMPRPNICAAGAAVSAEGPSTLPTPVPHTPPWPQGPADILEDSGSGYSLLLPDPEHCACTRVSHCQDTSFPRSYYTLHQISECSLL